MAGFLAALGGMAANAGMDSLSQYSSGAISNYFNRKAQKRTLEEGPRMQVAGLKKAGLNPMLAVSNGMTSPQQMPTQMSNAKSNANELLAMKSQAKQVHQNARMTEAQADQAVGESVLQNRVNAKLVTDPELFNAYAHRKAFGDSWAVSSALSQEYK